MSALIIRNKWGLKQKLSWNTLPSSYTELQTMNIIMFCIDTQLAQLCNWMQVAQLETM